MSFQAMAWAVKQDTKSPVSKLVLLMIANYADEKGEAYPSQDHLAKLCQCTRVSVNKHVKDLERSKYLSIRKTKNGMFGYNTYTLNLGLVNNIDKGLVNNINLVSKEYLYNTQDIQNSLFEDFWKNCPRKIAKKKTKSIYNNLIKKKEVTQNILITAMERYSESVKNTEIPFIVHPATWLNQGRWEDKIEVKEKNKNWLAG
jgi:hypothetical protein|tara:strand:+ start:34 stop:636 length:603 start_codon:yes stop_codon:yes gene_type:complete